MKPLSMHILIGGLIYLVVIFLYAYVVSAQNQEPMGLEEAERIVNEYGAILEAFGNEGCVVYDENALPYPKSKIRQAILTCLKALKDQPQKGEALRVAYIELGNFLPGVSKQDSRITKDNLADPEAIARHAELLKKGVAESDKLLKELHELESKGEI